MIRTTQLDNGLTVVTEEVTHVQSVSLGIWFSVGSRHEDEHNNGISHFIEHMLFKGTKRRTALEIAQELDFVGGHLNALTDKEYTCYYARVLSEHLPVAADVLSDMVRDSLYDPEELSRERNVILEEIKRYEDAPDELVHDLFVQNLFQGHPLGRSIIGTPETVGDVQREDIISYMDRLYQPDRCYVVTAGNVSHEDVIALFEPVLGRSEGHSESMEPVPLNGSERLKRYGRPTEQVHFCLGGRGPSQLDDDRYPLAVLDTAFGSGMSSRLFQEIREKRGLAYSVGSYPHSFAETGFFTLYAGTSPETLDEVLDICRKESENVRANGITREELERARNQIKGNLLLSLESMSHRMSSIAKSQIYFNRVIPIEEVVARVEAVTQDDVVRVAERVLDEKNMILTLIGPEEESAEA